MTVIMGRRQIGNLNSPASNAPQGDRYVCRYVSNEKLFFFDDTKEMSEKKLKAYWQYFSRIFIVFCRPNGTRHLCDFLLENAHL